MEDENGLKPADDAFSVATASLDALSEDLLSQHCNSLDLAWICALLVVDFDLELGQTIQKITPASFRSELTASLELDIAYLSFPDTTSSSAAISPSLSSSSSSSSSSSQVFSFRITNDSPSDRWPSSSSSSSSTKFPPHQRDIFYGFVYYLQRKDDTNPRGYLQRSIVLLTRWPFFSLFQPLITVLGQSYFDDECDPSVLFKSACDQISKWPLLPKIDTFFELPFLGTLLSFRSPFMHHPPSCFGKQVYNEPFFSSSSSSSSASQSSHPVSSSLSAISSSSSSSRISALSGRVFCFSDCNTPPISSIFKNLIHGLFPLWELVLLNEPILVLSSSSPAVCSSAVLALASLIAPISYMGDLRPFLVVHASDFKHLSAMGTNHSKQPFCPIIVGCTNPFFLRAMSSWPHVVAINGDNHSSSTSSRAHASSPFSSPMLSRHPSSSSVRQSPSPLSSPPHLPHSASVPSSLSSLSKASTSASNLLNKLTLSIPLFGSAKKIKPESPSPSSPSPAAASSSASPQGIVRVTNSRDLRDSLLWEFKELVSIEKKRHDPVSRVDKNLIKQLISYSDDPSCPSPSMDVCESVNSNTIRKYFLTRTEAFLEPLQRCFDHIWCSSSPTPFTSRVEWYKKFSTEAFMSYLEDNPDSYDNEKLFDASKSRILDFYRKFLGTSNFREYLHQKIRSSYRQDLAYLDPLVFARSRSSPEQKMETLRIVEQHLAEEEGLSLVDEQLCQRLREIAAALHA